MTAGAWIKDAQALLDETKAKIASHATDFHDVVHKQHELFLKRESDLDPIKNMKGSKDALTFLYGIEYVYSILWLETMSLEKHRGVPDYIVKQLDELKEASKRLATAVK